MQHVMIKTTTPPDMARAIADGVLAAENERLRAELERVSNELGMYKDVSSRGYAYRLDEIESARRVRRSLGSRLVDALCMAIFGAATVAQSVWQALRHR